MFRHLLIATLLNFICATVMAQSQHPTLSVDSSDVAHLIQNLRFDDALTLIKKNMAQAKKKRQSTARLERQQRQATICQQMLK